ncbi:MAG: DNA polymerase I [Armatimonadetes bacterium]|nr:DNA polymerase I [Armatimonadota bacterium]
MARKKLVIIDGYSLLFRAFYGTRYLSTADGRPTNALFGFAAMLLQIFGDHKPDAVLIALDAPGKTFRHDDYAEYKGTRREIPQELIYQLDSCRELIDDLNIPHLDLVGYEADDVVGTVSKQAEQNGYDTVIVTGDLDSLQLVDDYVSVMTTRKGVTDVVIYDPAAVKERYGFGPEYVPDYKALVGDTSDNIPGVPGIGEKSATILIQKFGTVEEMVKRKDEVEEKFWKKIEPNVDQMFKSKWLATIVRDAPLSYDFAPYSITRQSLEESKAAMLNWEFRSHAKRLDIVMAPYLVDGGDTAPLASVEREPVMAVLHDGKASWLVLNTWVGRQPYAVVMPPKAAQAAMFEDAPDDAYVAVGGEVRKAAWDVVAKLIDDRPAQLVAHETKPLLKRASVFSTPRFDATLAAYVLQSGRSSYELGDLVHGYLDLDAPTSPEHQAAALLALMPVMEARVELESQTKVLKEIELPLVPVLAEMEKAGIAVNSDDLREFSKQLQVAIEQSQARVWELAEQEFNIGSPKQIGEVLFEKLGLPGPKKTKTGWATGAEVLSELAPAYPVAGEILTYRELTKLKSTYADSLPKLVEDDGRIHTTFNQTVAATGRLSSIDPNLQNIPIRTELGRTIRRAFVAAPGTTLGSFDYSQIELRVLAHFCRDEALVEAFETGVDVHTVTASLMFQVAQDMVAKEQRGLAKMLNYAVLYGVTDFGLANQLGVGFGVAEAKALIQQYNERFPKVKAYTDGIVEEARSKGFTVTACGRRRYFSDIHAGNQQMRKYAERQAMNAPLQGTAADMIKLAMLDVRKLLGKSPTRMLLQVHDELLFEMPDGSEGLVEPIRAAMENALPLSVPVEVDAKKGVNWMQMTPLARSLG